MYAQNLFTLSVAALAGAAIAAEYNGGEIPAALRQGRGKNRASSSASMSMMASPSSSMAAMRSEMPSSAAMMMVTVTVTPTVTPSPSAGSSASPSASPSSSMVMQKSFTPKASPSSSHMQMQSSSASHVAMASSTPLTDKIGVPISDLVGNKDHKAGKKQPAPAAQIIDTGNVPVTTKDDCSLRCQSLAEQCVELLPKDNDFCFRQYPDCQDRCVAQHVNPQ